MKKFNALIVLVIFLVMGILIVNHSLNWFFIYFFSLIVLEILSYFLIINLRKNFQWLITSKDKYPVLDKEGLNKFLTEGYDKELGFVRKPLTSKWEIGKFGPTSYNINKYGARQNPRHEKLKKKISCHGDSFTFARQVNDNETWEWYLSELTKSNVMNFGVGNYGFDQGLLRLKREYNKNKTKIVIMGVVPSTIVRILSIWKHYNEFGNTFGFTPTFILQKGELKLIKNFIDSEEKFSKYKKYLPEIQKYDYFYKSKFKKEMIHFPYLISILSNPLRNIPLIYLISKYKWFVKDNPNQLYPTPMKVIMDVNLKLRYNLFTKDKYAVNLFEKLIWEFIKYAKRQNFIPIFLFMPQKDDILFIKKKGKIYYENFIREIEKDIFVVDLTKNFLGEKNIDIMYSDNNKYGGHYSKQGNKFVAEIIFKKLKEGKIL